MPSTPSILVCKCAQAGIVPGPAVEAVLAGLAASGQAAQVVEDLCRLAATRSPVLAEFARSKPLRIVACYPRAVKWLFWAAGAPLDREAEIVNLRILDGPTALDRLSARQSHPQRAAEYAPLQTLRENVGCENKERPPKAAEYAALQTLRENPGCENKAPSWKSWFPVIDFDRCNLCMQCLNFCLFGVFAIDEQRRITVAAAESCKPNCPACSRVCPEAAIIFPKYSNSPINGDEVAAEPGSREAIKADLSTLLGGDLYATLRERRLQNAPRFSKERDPAQALRERQRYLALAETLKDLPPEAVARLFQENKTTARQAMNEPARTAQDGIP